MSHDAVRATGVILSEWDTLNEYYSISDEARLKLIWATSLAHFRPLPSTDNFAHFQS